MDKDKSWGRKEVQKKYIIKENQHQHMLVLLLDGSALVFKNKKVIAQVKRGDFIAEMSFMSGEAAIADVAAVEKVRFIYWKKSIWI